MEIHHVGYAVKDISEAQKSFLSLGYVEESGVTDDEERKSRIKFLRNQLSGLRIELVEPMCDESPAASWLRKNGNSSVPYHICYVMKNIGGGVKQLQKDLWYPIGKLSPAPAIEGRNVIFMYHPSGGVIELLEAETGKKEGE
jgi:hypothetical protein